MRRPKAIEVAGGKPLVRRVYEAARRATGRVVVVTRPPLEERVRAVLPRRTTVLCDEPSVQTPLAGVVTGLQAVDTRVALLLGCDLPLLRPALLRRILEEIRGWDAAIPVWPDGMEEPLVAAYRVEATLRAARGALHAEERSLHGMVRRLVAVRYLPVDNLRLDDPELESFFNVNRPEDLRRIRTVLTRRNRASPRRSRR